MRGTTAGAAALVKHAACSLRASDGLAVIEALYLVKASGLTEETVRKLRAMAS